MQECRSASNCDMELHHLLSSIMAVKRYFMNSQHNSLTVPTQISPLVMIHAILLRGQLSTATHHPNISCLVHQERGFLGRASPNVLTFGASFKGWTVGSNLLYLILELQTKFSHYTLPVLWIQRHLLPLSHIVEPTSPLLCIPDSLIL